MKTVLHNYSFDTDKPEDREPWYQLETMLKRRAGAGHRMRSLRGDKDFKPESGEVVLETEFLFSNQWNTDKGRLFDWYQEAVFSYGKERNNIKRGHWLEITPEMVAIRNNTLKCCYTGEQFFFHAEKDGVPPKFNTRNSALGNPYLKESELYMVRLKRVSDESSPAQLTAEERDFLLPLYIKAQLSTNQKARDKQRAEVLADFEKEHGNAVMERDGFLWLLDHGMQIENCIFYDHKRHFCFGWRNAYTGAAR